MEDALNLQILRRATRPLLGAPLCLGLIAGLSLSATLPVAAQDALPELATATPASVEVAAAPDVAPAEATPTATADPQPTGRGRMAIEEIVVTAQKREQNLQDVPISVQAFSGDQLDAKGITEAKQLAQSTPGLVYGNIAGFSIIYLRGVGNDVFVPGGDASTANYIDGLYFSFLGGLSQSLGSVERIEVLKGPQGTLFGRNSTAGAINVITKDPGNSFEADAHFSYGTFDAYKSKVYVAGPLTETLSASIGVIYNQQDSYYRHIDPEHYGEGNLGGFLPSSDRGARAKLVWRPTDEFTAKLTGYSLNSDSSNGAILNAYQLKGAGVALGVSPRPAPYKSNINSETKNISKSNVVSFDMKYEFDDVTVKAISGYQEINYEASTDYDGSDTNLLSFGTPTFDRNFSQEVQLLSNPDGALSSLFGKPLTWIVGAYYFKDKTGFDPNDFGPPDVSQALNMIPLFSTPLGQLTAGLSNVLNPALADRTLAQLLDPGAVVRFYGILGIESYAAFTQATLDATDWLRFTLGARVQTEERKNLNSSVFLHQEVGGPDIPLTSFPQQTIKSTNVAPKFVVDVKPTDATLVYASVSKGYKSGTLNTVALIIPPQVVKPEEVTSYEIGTKSQFFDNRLRLNAALFRNEVKNGQVFFISVLSGGVANLENAGAYRINGADLDVTWQISDHWVASAGSSLLDGKYQDYIGSGYNQTPIGNGAILGTLQQDVDFSGNDTTRSPKYTVNGSLSYFKEIGTGQFEATVDGFYSDKFFFDAQNSIGQKAYGILNARVSYLYEPWNLRTTFFGRNLSDTVYANIRYGSDFANLENLATPREVGIQFDYSF